MNEEFPKRALQLINPATVWNAETDPNHANTPTALSTATEQPAFARVQGNRHERRKAAKLSRNKRSRDG